MPISTTILAVVVNLLATGLPLIGISIGTESLETTVQTIVAIATGVWIWRERVKVGDVNVAGLRK